jgi:uncharacterized cupredoxin-like copper-binding protein
VKPRLLAVPAACAALAVAGCGGSDDNSSDTNSAAPADTQSAPATTPAPNPSAGGQELQISADPSGQFKFDKTSLTAKAGKVSIKMANPSSVPHAIGIEGPNGTDEDGNTVGQGGSSTISVTLKPGKYEFYCPVDGHRDAGMKGTLTVK